MPAITLALDRAQGEAPLHLRLVSSSTAENVAKQLIRVLHVDASQLDSLLFSCSGAIVSVEDVLGALCSFAAGKPGAETECHELFGEAFQGGAQPKVILGVQHPTSAGKLVASNPPGSANGSASGSRSSASRGLSPLLHDQPDSGDAQPGGGGTGSAHGAPEAASSGGSMPGASSGEHRRPMQDVVLRSNPLISSDRADAARQLTAAGARATPKGERAHRWVKHA